MRHNRVRWLRPLWSGLALVAVGAAAPGAPLVLAQGARPAAAARPPVPGAPTGVTAFVDVAVVPMDRERVLEHQTVLVQGGWITALGPTKKIKVPAGAVRIAGRGKYLLPGLADMHAHIEPDRAKPEGALPKHELFLYVANGVTTIRDMGSGPVHLALRARAAQGELLSPRIYTGGPTPAQPTDSAVAAVKTAGYDFIGEIGSTNGRGGDPQGERAFFDSLMAAAARVGIRVAGHVPVGLARALEAHMWSTEHLYGYLQAVDARIDLNKDGDTVFWRQPSYQLDPTHLRALAETVRRSGVWTCPTLVARAASMGPTLGPIGRRLAELNNQVIRALQAADAGLLLGTDAPVFKLVPGFSVSQELALFVAAGLTPYQALTTGTRSVAAFFGTLDSTGTVAVGKRADLVLLYGNPLQDIDAVAGPAGVMLGGRWLPRAELEARLDSLETYSYGRFDLKGVRQGMWRHPVAP